MMLKVEVLDIDIEGGMKRNPHKCPVARAVARTVRNSFLGVSSVHVTRRFISFENVNERWKFKTPAAVVIFIERFDQGDEVDPFEFEIQE
jgi:hypothetical protein